MQRRCAFWRTFFFYVQKPRPDKAASRLAATPLARLYRRRRGDTKEKIAGSSYG